MVEQQNAEKIQTLQEISTELDALQEKVLRAKVADQLQAVSNEVETFASLNQSSEVNTNKATSTAANIDNSKSSDNV